MEGQPTPGHAVRLCAARRTWGPRVTKGDLPLETREGSRWRGRPRQGAGTTYVVSQCRGFRWAMGYVLRCAPLVGAEHLGPSQAGRHYIEGRARARGRVGLLRICPVLTPCPRRSTSAHGARYRAKAH
eukprot:scaffold7626_cov134-Isochrysis_galbana.AAC.4